MPAASFVQYLQLMPAANLGLSLERQDVVQHWHTDCVKIEEADSHHAELRAQQKNGPAGPLADMAILEVAYALDEEQDAADVREEADLATQARLSKSVFAGMHNLLMDSTPENKLRQIS